MVDDHALVREGLCQVLKGLTPDEPTEVLQAANCASAFAMVNTHPDLDLVLLDYQLPDMTGLAALAVLGKKHPELPIVILSGSANPSIMQQALAMGASGFVTKSGRSEELLCALRQVLNGEIYEPSCFSAFHDDMGLSGAPKPRQTPVFSPRQLEVLQLLLDGFTNREIANKLFVGEETVKTHVTTIMRAFNAKTRTQAATEATRWGYRKSSSMG
ncbi:response regulator transcription factor [Rhodoferax sp.]|uniref:response regulator transcription factor n=1 Tax=Rhodoferax sp. TaxID=50421 RepID=UPI00260B1B90|nr:response regulator transcription factor [Rhodoferax sp.]MDD2811318.1 response regulator transcription factor [Rhodoferax sp.]MDD5480194.1 response regulator transcription factor [Rhodoferax sp.]